MIHCVWMMHLGIFIGFLQYLMKRKSRSKCCRGHVVSKCKDNEFEGIVVIKFGFMEESWDVP